MKKLFAIILISLTALSTNAAVTEGDNCYANDVIGSAKWSVDGRVLNGKIMAELICKSSGKFRIRLATNRDEFIILIPESHSKFSEYDGEPIWVHAKKKNGKFVFDQGYAAGTEQAAINEARIAKENFLRLGSYSLVSRVKVKSTYRVIIDDLVKQLRTKK